MLLRAVIFDFDGVIADTERLHYLAFERILEPLSLGISWEAYVESCIGFDDRDVFRYRFRQDPSPMEDGGLETLIARKAQAFLDLVEEEGAPVYPGVPELISALQGASIPLALCSGAVRSDIAGILSGTPFADAFPIQVTAEDVAHSKPDPEGYRLAAQRLLPNLGSSELNRVIAIEDTPTGLASAVSAGFTTVAVTNTHPASALDDANFVVTSLEGLAVAELAGLVTG